MIEHHPIGSDYLYLSGISAGPDGNPWFTYQDFTTSANAIGRITTTGAISLFPTRCHPELWLFRTFRAKL